MNREQLIADLKTGNRRAIARCITVVENELDGYQDILKNLDTTSNTPIVGITGPPGAGKSSLLNAITKQLIAKNKTVAIVAVDPTSPFNFGSLLGDRIRMSEHFTHPNVFIRSLATRGALGGLADKIFEIVDVLRSAKFDYIFVETVGVGQSEVEIAGLADTTVLALVPEAGDDVQTIKSGVMEIADIFVINKADRDGASTFVKNISQLISEKHGSGWLPKIVKTVATKDEGIEELISAIDEHNALNEENGRKYFLLAEKALVLIQKHRMNDINKKQLMEEIKAESNKAGFNLYRYITKFY